MAQFPGVTRITSRIGHESSPVVAPNGKKVAFEWWQRTPNGLFTSDIWIVNSEGMFGYQQITDVGPRTMYPNWSPDESEIIFTTDVTSAVGLPINFDVVSVSSAGMSGMNLRLGGDDADFAADIGPNNQLIAFSRLELANNPAPFFGAFDVITHFYFWPPLLPYGNQFAQSWVCTMPAQGGPVTYLTQGIDPDISPDGSKIVYSSYANGGWDIYTMNIDGTSQIQITSGKSYKMDPCWSPDGNWIAFCQTVQTWSPPSTPPVPSNWPPVDIWIYNVNTNQMVMLTAVPPTAYHLSPTWGYVDVKGTFRDFIYFSSNMNDPQYMNTGFDIYRVDPDHAGGEVFIEDKTSLSSNNPTKTKAQTTFKCNNARSRVLILNSTNINGYALRTKNKISTKYFDVFEIGNSKIERDLSATRIYFKSGLSVDAENLSEIIPTSVEYRGISETEEETKGADIVIVLGA